MCITNPLKISDFQGNLLHMLLFSQKHAFYFSILRIKEGLSHVQQPLFLSVLEGGLNWSNYQRAKSKLWTPFGIALNPYQLVTCFLHVLDEPGKRDLFFLW